jgi:DNA-binding PadR family transcriptional regulator
MPLQHAVLALLADGPSHGYDLRERFEHAVGPQWGLNVGHLYQVLDRLHRDGLATAEVVPQAQRPDRTVYRITSAGVDELESWLATPVVRTRGYRDDFFLKLMAAARRGPAALDEVIRTQRQGHLQQLRSLAKVQAGDEADIITRLLVEAATLHTKADLAVVDLAEQNAPQLLAGAEASAARQSARPQRSAAGRGA